MANGWPETVTVLFTDLVGSTAWRSRVGDSVADVRTAELERASREIVESAGGTVVKSVGDGIMATFTGAVAALDVAARLQAVARRLIVGGTDSLRIGISTGDMVRSGDDWLGVAAIEASRLCGEADGGATLVADLTVRLAGSRSSTPLRPIGERVLRGFDAPVQVYELLSSEDPAGSLPLALERASLSTLVGRRDELGRLETVLDATAAGGAPALLIVGEPGIGKTRLAAAIAADATGRGFVVLHGRCDEGIAAPYRPVIEAIDPWMADLPHAALDRIVGDGRDVLAYLWPHLATDKIPAPAGDAESQRWRLFEAVAAVVSSIANDRPVLLVIDDLQWAEPSSRLLLTYLVRKAIAGVALVATVRRAEAGGDPIGLLGGSATGRSIDTIDLVGLASEDVGELVAQHAGAIPPDELSALLWRQTDGNPFFLGALLAHLDNVAFVRGDGETWLTPAELEAAGVPAGVRAVVDRRLGVLNADARRALDVAAVCGLAFEERIVTKVGGASVDASVEALDEAVAASLVREERIGEFVFVHALVRQTVLEALSRTRRARLHWRIAEELERGTSDGTHVGEIAAHYASAGEAGDPATIVRTSLAAGEEALARIAFDEAAGHLRTALDALAGTPADPDLRYRVLTALGRALNALSDLDAAKEMWMEAAATAEAARDPVRLLDALLGFGYILNLTVEPELDLLRRLDVVLDLVGPADSPRRAMALGFKQMQRVRMASGLANDEELSDGVEMARRTGDVNALASTLRSRLTVLAQGPHAEAMLRDAQELASLTSANRSATGDPTTTGRDTVRALLRLGRRAEAEQLLAAHTLEAARTGLRMALNNAVTTEASIATASGEFAAGKRLAAEAAQSANRQLVLVELSYTGQVLAIRMEQGRLDDVIPVLRRLDDYAISLPPWRAMLVSALADAGSLEEASMRFDQILEHITNGFSHVFGAPLAVRHVCEVCRQLGDRALAVRLLPHAQEWSSTLLVTTTSIEGAADRSIGHLLATLGRYDEADVAYEAAAELERSAGFPPLLARTEYWHARALLERDSPGDRERAAGLLDEVIEITERLGMQLLNRQAGELAASRLTPR